MRNKWKEKVTYTEVSKPDFGEKKSLTMFNGENGDLYVAIHDENIGIAGKTIRIERSGGASTRNPRLVEALTIAYDAIAENEEQYDIKSKNGIYIESKQKFEIDIDIENIIAVIKEIKIIANNIQDEEDKLIKKFIQNFKKKYKIIEK